MTAEAIEGEVREVDEPRALAPVPPQTQVILGSAALARMSDAEFDANLKVLEVSRQRADKIKRALMVDGTDYGTVPGVTRAFLFKSGAETLDKAFGLVASFTLTRVRGNGEDEPPYSFHAHSLLHLGSTDGPIVGEGFGTCNPWESRYRYRKAERVCPNCGVAAVIKGKAEYGGGWLCWKKKDGCGAKWPDGAPEIEGQESGNVENPDPWDLENTIAKMAEKRSHVDGTISATGTSGLFTQDEDSPAVAAQATAAKPASLERSNGGLIGVASLGTSAPVDGELRQVPEGGYGVGFVIGEGREKVQVVAVDPLASALKPLLSEFVGTRVQVWGTMTAETMTVRGKKIPFNRLHLDRIETSEFTLPAPGVADDEFADLKF